MNPPYAILGASQFWFGDGIIKKPCYVACQLDEGVFSTKSGPQQWCFGEK
jgi:hypothetical protein